MAGFVVLAGLLISSGFAEEGTASRPTAFSVPADGQSDEAVEPRVFLKPGPALIWVRRQLAVGDEQFRAALNRICDEADKALSLRPPSVMDKKALPPSGDKHDYMSLGSYWWPNPQAPNGLPYIRKDGQYNPEGNQFDVRPLHAMCRAVDTLALAYFLTGRQPYARKAAELIRVWFLEPPTRMNPHLRYGQAIPGVTEGRGLGIIDTRPLTELVDSVGLLKGSTAWKDSDQKGLVAWFEAYLTWLLESDHGKEEAVQPNNHGTYYDVQVASFALFVGRKGLARETLNRSAERRLVPQIEPDGRQPWELRRTKAWDYSVANLAGMVDLATLSGHFGVDLWRYESADGRGIRKAVDWLAQYADGEKKFPYQQITPPRYERFAEILRRAARAYRDPRYEQLIARMPRTDLSAAPMQLVWPAAPNSP